MLDYREDLKDKIREEEFDRTYKLGSYMMYGVSLGGAISIGSTLYEATKLEDFLHDPIKDPLYILLGLGIMAASIMFGSLGSLVSQHSRDKKLKSLDEIVPSSF